VTTLRATLSSAVAAVVVSGVLACGGGGRDEPAAPRAGRTLTIYSILPLQGQGRAASIDIDNGQKLALQDARGRAGRFRIRYRSLDAATAATGRWEPGRVSANARRAVSDRSTIAYLGDASSGAAAISIPILNEAGILLISPTNTYVGLTRAEGADRGEPGQYYPTGQRTFGRVVPADHVQAAAQVSYQRDKGCTRVFVLHDKGVYGKGLADTVARIGRQRGLELVETAAIDTQIAVFRSLADRIAAADANCVFFGGNVESHAVKLFRDVAAVNPAVRLFGPDSLAVPAFTEELGRELERRTYVTSPTLAPNLYPPAGREFFARYRRRHGRDPATYAIYGYEAMKLALAAIEQAGARGDDRAAVVRAFFRVKRRESVLGAYAIDGHGDTTLQDYGGYRVSGGELAFDQVIHAAG